MDKKKSNDLVVFSILKDSQCEECGEELERGRFLFKEKDKGLCMACAEMDHLAFLPRGDAALTRRASKYSKLRAVVVRWSRSRNRYERQGVLVEVEALDQAEKECEADSDIRALRRELNRERLEELDQRYIAEFAAAVRGRYPACPLGAEQNIAIHACRKYSGRVGRSATAKRFDSEALDLAVRAHIRHHHTNYDDLLMDGHDRRDARASIEDEANEIVNAWLEKRP
ncbi:MAG: DUF2293 domain-containing protein [Candidatus Sumerlaeota bacterium]|nr:DUF2293 domain-containing protein [Candidatus Sumerlaeota bacterium]